MSAQAFALSVGLVDGDAVALQLRVLPQVEPDALQGGGLGGAVVSNVHWIAALAGIATDNPPNTAKCLILLINTKNSPRDNLYELQTANLLASGKANLTPREISHSKTRG